MHSPFKHKKTSLSKDAKLRGTTLVHTIGMQLIPFNARFTDPSAPQRVPHVQCSDFHHSSALFSIFHRNCSASFQLRKQYNQFLPFRQSQIHAFIKSEEKFLNRYVNRKRRVPTIFDPRVQIKKSKPRKAVPTL